MTRDEINENISSTTPISEDVSGSALLSYSKKAANTSLMAQVIRVASSGNYEVDLEAGVVTRDGKLAFGKIGSFTQAEDKQPSVFDVSLKCRVRFRHVSGVEVTVRLNG